MGTFPYHFKQHSSHCADGLANLLTLLNLPSFAFHCGLVCLCLVDWFLVNP